MTLPGTPAQPRSTTTLLLATCALAAVAARAPAQSDLTARGEIATSAVVLPAPQGATRVEVAAMPRGRVSLDRDGGVRLLVSSDIASVLTVHELSRDGDAAAPLAIAHVLQSGRSKTSAARHHDVRITTATRDRGRPTRMLVLSVLFGLDGST